MPIRREVELWIREAEHDLEHAIKSLEIGHYNWSCFASQQTVEKALKAAILHMFGVYERTHDLVKLLKKLKDTGLTLSVTNRDLVILSSYYTQTRYPNAGIEEPSLEFTKEQAEEAIEIAKKILDEIKRIIRDP